MTVQPGENAAREHAATEQPDASLPDAGHLDEDAEALEDPVHAGDAIHQHELHEQQHELREQQRGPAAG